MKRHISHQRQSAEYYRESVVRFQISLAKALRRYLGNLNLTEKSFLVRISIKHEIFTRQLRFNLKPEVGRIPYEEMRVAPEIIGKRDVILLQRRKSRTAQHK